MEQIGQDTTKGKKGNGAADKAQGRKGKGDNQPAVMDVTKLLEALPRLKKLKIAADEANEDLNNAITKEAEKAGLLSAVARKVVNAWSSDDFEEEHRKVEQLALAFDAAAKA